MQLRAKLAILAALCVIVGVAGAAYLKFDKPGSAELQHSENAQKAQDKFANLSRQSEIATAAGNLDQAQIIIRQMRDQQQTIADENKLQETYRRERDDHFSPFYKITGGAFVAAFLLFICAWLSKATPTPRP